MAKPPPLSYSCIVPPQALKHAVLRLGNQLIASQLQMLSHAAFASASVSKVGQFSVCPWSSSLRCVQSEALPGAFTTAQHCTGVEGGGEGGGGEGGGEHSPGTLAQGMDPPEPCSASKAALPAHAQRMTSLFSSDKAGVSCQGERGAYKTGKNARWAGI